MNGLYGSAGLFEVNVPDYKQLKVCRRYVYMYVCVYIAQYKL